MSMHLAADSRVRTPDPGSGEVIPALGEKARKRKPYGQWVSGSLILAVIFMFIWTQAGNENLDWSGVGQFMFHPAILKGITVTLQLAVFSMMISVVLAFGIALMCQSRNRVASAVGKLYVWFFRGVPLLVQILIWFNLAVLYPTILGTDTNQLISGFTAGLCALSLAESGYMAEIIRGGIISVNKGQTEAGLSIGLTRGQALRRIVLPQTIRVIIPPTGNQFIGLLKASSLVSAIGGSDLLTQTQLIYGQNFKIVPLLIVATAWYLILVSVASVGQYFLERKFNPEAASSGLNLRQIFTGRPARRQQPSLLTKADES
ncbi:amino acid ABC transporter permease [Paenarthrobacter sp. NPDC092416]|uniref:amino acid ABC transporter permease n=1 Tax=Paenarthrobacter sp. NPDC092416 TaxID=3364386 RepID=UPI00381A9063